MDMDSHDTSSVRRRRRVARPSREKTPDPTFATNGRRKYSEDDSSQLDATTASEETNVQTVSMQIRPPRTMSAHESKILRRRDKTFASAAARSHSQPREAEHLTSPEAHDLIRTVKRSLSTPRHKEEPSENDFETEKPQFASTSSQRDERQPPASAADENLSRLEQNLRRFEEERKRFETEKRQFEHEKREHKLRYKQLNDSEERKRLLQNYRKLSDRIQLPADAEERRRMVHSLRLQRNEVPTLRRRNRVSGGYEESSTQFSSSEADADEVGAQRLAKQLSPVRRSNSNKAALQVASVRGPPPEPPKVPVRRSVSRNNSLSPIRPQRRSKTPEQRAEIMRKLNENAENVSIHSLPIMSQEPKLETTANSSDTQETQHLHKRQTTPSASLTKNELSQSVRRDSLTKTEPKRKLSLERQEQRRKSLEIKASSSSKVSQEIADESIAKETPSAEKRPSLLRRFFNYFSRQTAKPKPIEQQPAILSHDEVTLEVPMKIISKNFLRLAYKDAVQQWCRLKADYPQEVTMIRTLRNKCFAHTIVLIMLCGFGGLMFRYTEGTAENIYKCEVRKVKRDFIDHLWTVSHNMREDDWKSMARQKLRKFEEELHALQELGIRRFPGQKSWNFVNCILYCWTVITTIGYGHITPKTTLGQSLTIIYAIIGIPMFLILLADFGKLFTRGMKFIWAYVRRLYYTGTCRQIRKQQQVRDAIGGFNTVYDMAIRRPSHFFGIAETDPDVESQVSATGKSGASHPETPTSPYPETFEIDDEFNLPVSLASILLISYILFGAFVYTLWEDWSYFEAFYFVFISMSTIGFGDLVPNHPIFMMCSIIYLVFGLALTSMFINVVQIKLSDTFKHASAKIGATIGFGLASEVDEDGISQAKTGSDLASVHGSRLGKIGENDKEQGRSTATPQPLTSILRQPRPTSPVSRDIGINDMEQAPPPLLPRRQISVEQPAPEAEKKKRRFFK